MYFQIIFAILSEGDIYTELNESDKSTEMRELY